MENIKRETAAEIPNIIEEKYSRGGIGSLSETEMLTLILTMSGEEDASSAAERLLSIFGTLDNILFTAHEKLEQACRISCDSIALIKLIPSVSYARNFGGDKPFCIDSPYLAKVFFEKLLFDPTCEIFAAAAVDEHFRKAGEMFIISGGTSKDVTLSSTELAAYALGCCTKYIFIAHSHPEGNSQPSNSDISSTAELVRALYLLGINVIDHIITGRDSAFSMRTQGFAGMFPPADGYAD